MKKSQLIFELSVFCVVLLLGCTDDNDCTRIWSVEHLNSVAQNAGNEVCEISRTNSGENCDAILIFEENHLSVAGQIEQAIALVRLHNHYDLNDIALEAYLKNEEEIDIDWFVNATKGDTISKISIVVNLLKEGEINAAEFLKLLYHDIRIHKVEKEGEYNVEVTDEATTAPIHFLYRVALLSISENYYSRIRRLSNEFEQAQKTNNEEKIRKKAAELLEFVIHNNEWTSEKYKELNDVQNKSTAEIVKLYNEIDKKANERVRDLTYEEKSRMSDLIAFYSARDKANITIKESVINIPQISSDSLIALIIGAAHTQGISKEFFDAQIPYVVLTPLSLFNNEDTGILDYGTSFKRKMNGKSVFNDSFIAILDDIFNKKPRPVLNNHWFQAKSEFNFFTDKITRNILGPPVPPNGGQPPFGFKSDEFQGKWIWIDPKKIAIIDDKSSGINSKAALFEVTIFHEDGENQTTLWVKSGLNNSLLSRDEEINVEKMLIRALNEVKAINKLPSQIKDSKGRIKISIKTIVAIASTKEEVIQIGLSVI